eukprot:scaffold343_cov245-Pinguiococcus_pyrenoidosus.AAC.4
MGEPLATGSRQGEGGDECVAAPPERQAGHQRDEELAHAGERYFGQSEAPNFCGLCTFEDTCTAAPSMAEAVTGRRSDCGGVLWRFA